MKKIYIFLLVLLCAELAAQRAVPAIEPDPSAALQIMAHRKGFILPQLSSKEIKAIQNPAQGLMVIDLDKRCIAVYFDGSWHCLMKGGGSWFSKDLYVVMGKVDKSGQSQGRDFSSTKSGTGDYQISLNKGLKLISVTASIVETNSGEDWDMRSRVSILGRLNPRTNGDGNILYQTTGSDGTPQDRPIWFIALVKPITTAAGLPPYAKRLYPLGGQVNADGSIQSGVGFSVQHSSTGVYQLSFDKGFKVLAINATIKDANELATRGIKLKTYNGFLYETSDENGTLQDAAVSFTAIVEYSFEVTNLLEYNRHMRSGAITANGEIYRGKEEGFSVERAQTPGTYKVTFEQGVKRVQSVTINLLGDQTDGRNGVVIRKIEGNGFTYSTARWGSPKQAADLPVVFNAVVD